MVNLGSRKFLVAVSAALVITLALEGLILGGVIPLNLNFSCLGVPGASRTFTIIADVNGFNNSRTIAGYNPWPIMNVTRCDHVTLRLVNTDNQAHGLAVGALAMVGIVIPPGQTQSLSFLADKTGHWRVYCTLITCTVHEWMANGQLNVT